MAALDRIFLFIAGGAGLVLVLWYMLAFRADAEDYLSLIRSGFLLIGLAGVAWGLLCHRPRIAFVGLLFLILGFVTFFVGPGLAPFCVFGQPDLTGQDWWWQIHQGLVQPLTRSGHICLWHVVVAGWIALNAILLANHADARRFVAANTLALVATGIAGLMLSG